MSNEQPIVGFAKESDEQFFRVNPDRRLRARPYIRGEFGWDEQVPITASSAVGQFTAADTVIVERSATTLTKHPYADARDILLDTDERIAEFMHVRTIEPKYRGLKARPK